MGKKLYVGNIPFNADEQALRDLFTQHGTVDTVKKQFKSKSIEDIFVSIYNEKSSEVAK